MFASKIDLNTPLALAGYYHKSVFPIRVFLAMGHINDKLFFEALILFAFTAFSLCILVWQQQVSWSTCRRTAHLCVPPIPEGVVRKSIPGQLIDQSDPTHSRVSQSFSNIWINWLTKKYLLRKPVFLVGTNIYRVLSMCLQWGVP